MMCSCIREPPDSSPPTDIWVRQSPSHHCSKDCHNFFYNFKSLNTMKTIKTVGVNFLRIYPVEREVTSSVNGVKGTRAGALILRENLPASAGQNASNAVELSGKQLDNLASMHGIRATGRKGWSQLATLVGVGKSACTISCEEHAKGDKYVDREGVEQEYTKTSTNCNVDSIVLSDKVVSMLQAKTIDAIINWDEEDSLTAILNPSVNEPVVADVK